MSTNPILHTVGASDAMEVIIERVVNAYYMSSRDCTAKYRVSYCNCSL